jgi:hypothetical protein
MTETTRAGGVFETIMVNDADGSEYPSLGVFVEVVEPELGAPAAAATVLEATITLELQPYRGHVFAVAQRS